MRITHEQLHIKLMHWFTDIDKSADCELGMSKYSIC